MTFYTNLKAGNVRSIKLLGLNVYVHEKSPEYTSQKFLCGSIATITVVKGNTWEKTINFFGIPVVKRTDELFFRKIYLGNFLVKINDLRESFKKRYSKFIDERHDDVYILNSNSGEAYLFLAYFSKFILNNGSKNPLIVAQKMYHIDLIKMLCPQIPYVYIPSIKNLIPCEMFEAGSQRFFIMFPPKYYADLERDIHKNPNVTIHYLSRILEILKISTKNNTAQVPIPSSEVELEMLKKVDAIGLNLNKFIFVSPDAQSNPSLSNEFWSRLSEEMERLGYNLFFNTVPFESNLKNVKTCFLSFEEAYVLSQRSKGIIALRSGFVELLSTIKNLPIICLYTPFKKRGSLESMPAGTVLKSFTLKLLPNIDIQNIHEFDMFKTSENELLEYILKDIYSPKQMIGVK